MQERNVDIISIFVKLAVYFFEVFADNDPRKSATMSNRIRSLKELQLVY